MISFIRNYIQFILILVLWTLLPFYAGAVAGHIIVGVSILFFLMRQNYLALFLGFFYILLLSDNLHEGLHFAKSFKNFYMLIFGMILFTNKEVFKPFSSIINQFIPFFLIAIFALQFSGKVDIGIQKTLSYILLVITVPNFFRYLFNKYGTDFLKELVYFFLLIIIVGYFIKFINFDFAYIEGNRMRGMFGNPNGLGIFLFLFFSLYIIVVSFYPNLFSINERRFILIIVFAALILCSSRTAFFSIFILLFFSRIQNISPLLGLILLLAIIFSYEFLLGYIVNLVSYGGLQDYFRINTLQEGSGRFIAWGFAWEKIQNFFYFGGGLGNDEYIMRQHYDILTRLGHQGGVHNSFLTLWFDTGLIGLVLYFRGLFLAFIKGAKKSKLAIPFFYAVLFSITYESWIAGSLNPFTIVLFLSVTLLYEDEFVPNQDHNQLEIVNEK